jgi:uncharacterized membrane protein YagU involved in acid resistance
MSLPANRNALKTILFTGIVAGFLDALAAIINYYIVTGKSPVIVFNFIASGVLGSNALTGGLPIAFLGLLFHFIIATIFAAFYFLIYPFIEKFSKNRFANGVVYAIFVWLVMNLVVVPLSNAPKQSFHWNKALLAAGILVVCIGMPISYIISSYYSKKNN